jgi:hypothetical protein
MSAFRQLRETSIGHLEQLECLVHEGHPQAREIMPSQCSEILCPKAGKEGSMGRFTGPLLEMRLVVSCHLSLDPSTLLGSLILGTIADQIAIRRRNLKLDPVTHPGFFPAVSLFQA